MDFETAERLSRIFSAASNFPAQILVDIGHFNLSYASHSNMNVGIKISHLTPEFAARFLRAADNSTPDLERKNYRGLPVGQIAPLNLTFEALGPDARLMPKDLPDGTFGFRFFHPAMPSHVNFGTGSPLAPDAYGPSLYEVLSVLDETTHWSDIDFLRFVQPGGQPN